MIKAARLLVAALVALFAGCLTTTQQVQTNGEELEVRLDSFEHGAYVDDNLRYHPAGTTVIFEGFHQGTEEVDELDFYYIAGAQKQVDGIVAWRESYNRGALLSGGVFGAGALLMTGGLAWYAVGLAQNPDQGLSGSPAALGASALFLGGGTIMGLGIYAFYAQFFGPSQPLNDSDNHKHLYPIEGAIGVAETYNQAVRGGGSPGAPPAP